MTIQREGSEIIVTNEWASKPILDVTDFQPNVWGEGYHTSEFSHYVACVCCGRKTGRGRITIALGAGGFGLIHPDDVTAGENFDLGWLGIYVLGSVCGKRIPAEYRIQEEAR
jgi:hypothetical protein